MRAIYTKKEVGRRCQCRSELGAEGRRQEDAADGVGGRLGRRHAAVEVRVRQTVAGDEQQRPVAQLHRARLALVRFGHLRRSTLALIPFVEDSLVLFRVVCVKGFNIYDRSKLVCVVVRHVIRLVHSFYIGFSTGNCLRFGFKTQQCGFFKTEASFRRFVVPFPVRFRLPLNPPTLSFDIEARHAEMID